VTDATLRARLEAGDTLYTAWCLLPEPLTAEMLARQDWDCVTLDCQHGFIDYADMLAMVMAIQGAGKPALVRAPLGDEGFIGKALDAGADCIIAPMINTPEDARWFAEASNYPPIGQRSWGPMRAMDVAGLDKDAYLAKGNDLTLAWAMLETEEALSNIDTLFTTPGIDGVFVGPNDLCNSLTGGEYVDPGHEKVVQALELVLEKTREHKGFAAIYASTPEVARAYADQGFQFIALGSDAGFLRNAAASALAAAKA